MGHVPMKLVVMRLTLGTARTGATMLNSTRQSLNLEKTSEVRKKVRGEVAPAGDETRRMGVWRGVVPRVWIGVVGCPQR